MKKKDELAITHSGVPQFESNDLYELETFKSQVIDDRHNSGNTSFENEIYDEIIDDIQNHIKQYAKSHYFLNGKLPDGTKEVVSYIPTKEDQNKTDFTIDEWSDLQIKVGINDITFVKKGTGKTSEHRLNKFGWKKNLKTQVIRELSKGELRYVDFVSHVKSKQTIKNQIYQINKKLKHLFNLDVNPIVHKNGKWITMIDIQMLDADEYILDVNKNIMEKISMESTKDKRDYEYDETYHTDAMQDYLRTRHNEDEEY